MSDIRPYYEPGMDDPMPFLGCGPAIGLARMCEESDGTLVTETLVLTNLVIFFGRDRQTGTRIGDHRMCSAPWARRYLAELPSVVAHVNECEDHDHAGRYMEMLDPDAELT